MTAPVTSQRMPVTCAIERASRLADRAVFRAASRAPVFTVTLAPVHTIDRARLDRAAFHAISPAAFIANDLTCIVHFYPPRRDLPTCAGVVDAERIARGPRSVCSDAFGRRLAREGAWQATE